MSTAQYFVGAMFDYFGKSRKIYENIASTIQTSISGLQALVDSSASTSTFQTQDIINNIVDGATQLADDFFQVSVNDVTFESEIVHPPPVSGSGGKGSK